MHSSSHALVELGCVLRDDGYNFITVTPETHRRVNANAERRGYKLARTAQAARDVFGWSRPFDATLLPGAWVELLEAADALDREGDLLRSRVRFSTLGGGLYVHSAFPTAETDAVFFGPDTYRFCSLLQRWMPAGGRAVDVGCGSGAGGIAIASKVQACVLADINPRALELARVNAELNGVVAEVVASDVLDGVAGQIDVVIANPPYMRDDSGRVYRDGGGTHGQALATRIVHDALRRLGRGGTLIVYTGAAIVDGEDTFLRAVTPLLRPSDVHFVYEELDPDVFGEELERPAYAEVERIAAVGLRVEVR
ncbi:MAG TPA: class I SAM-dependent methyltransferase [Polyangiales bacterium]